MKDPAFLFYPNDYIGGTMGMTFEEKGAYMELLMMQFNRGHMGGHMIGQVVGQIWDKIQHKFKQDENGLWYNERLELEINRRKAFTESRKNNLKGINQHTKKEGHMDGHMTSHMENRNENRNKDKNIPTFEKFTEYALEKKSNICLESLKLKYESWLENNWRDGYNKKIVNWKSKLLNTLPHIKTKEVTAVHPSHQKLIV